MMRDDGRERRGGAGLAHTPEALERAVAVIGATIRKCESLLHAMRLAKERIGQRFDGD